MDWMRPNRVAIAVSHNDQKDHLRSVLDDLGFPAIRVDREQAAGAQVRCRGRVASPGRASRLGRIPSRPWSPLRDADPAPACVRCSGPHRRCRPSGVHPQPSDAWLGEEWSAETDGWFAHRIAFDQSCRTLWTCGSAGRAAPTRVLSVVRSGDACGSSGAVLPRRLRGISILAWCLSS